jgi:Tfp pilus assembly protein PilF
MITSSGYFRGTVFTLTLILASPIQGQQPITNAPAAPSASAPASSTNAAAPTPPVLTPAQLQDQAIAAQARDILQLMQNQKMDEALDKLNATIKQHPKTAGFYSLRGALYSHKNQWPQSEQDFQAALQLEPDNVVVKFNLAEIKFMQKQYDDARPGFVALQKDPDMGDLASYKVFLCDLFGGHEDIAKAELEAFNKADSKPSYYFGNAAWDLYNKNIEDARGWLVSASNIYPPQKNEFYATSLRELKYLPLPPPPSPAAQ